MRGNERNFDNRYKAKVTKMYIKATKNMMLKLLMKLDLMPSSEKDDGIETP